MNEKGSIESGVNLEQLPVQETNINPSMEATVAEQPELSPEEKIRKLSGDVTAIQEKLGSTIASIQDTKSKLNEVRVSMGLLPTDEDPPSVAPDRAKIIKLTQEQALLEKQKNELDLGQSAPTENSLNIVSPEEGAILGNSPAEVVGENKADSLEGTNDDFKENPEEEDKKVSEGLLAQISESIRIKNELSLRVGMMRESPGFKQFEQASLVLQEKRKKLEGLKKPKNSGGFSVGGSISINGSSSINIEGSISVQSESQEEKKEIDLEKEASNLLARTKIEILRLQKDEMEYGPEGLEIKNAEVELELEMVQVETDIWSSGSMNEELFGQLVNLVSSPEGAGQDFANKDLFVAFVKAGARVEANREKNIGFYQKIDAIQSEIEVGQKSIEDLEIPNESKILGMLDTGSFGGGEEFKKEDDTNLTSTEGAHQEKIEDMLGVPAPIDNAEAKWTSGADTTPQ